MPSSKLTPLARKLRTNSTTQEKKLWYQFLNKAPVRFHRQKVIGNYIVDFYCHQAGLVIELDGGQHYENQAMEADQTRTDSLESMGIMVIRFTNRDVDHSFNEVCAEISRVVENRLIETHRS